MKVSKTNNLSVVVLLAILCSCFLSRRCEAQVEIIALGDLPGGSFSSFAQGVSDNGMVVVGWGSVERGAQAFRWSGGQMAGLGGSDPTRALAVSGDGKTIVGVVEGFDFEAFRCDPIVGFQLLGDLPGGIFNSSATAVTYDGSTIVGTGNSTNGSLDEAFAWSESTGMVGLGWEVTENAGGSLATGVSRDGFVVVGYGFDIAELPGGGTTTIPVAFRWTKPTDYQVLPSLDGGLPSSIATDVSEDGFVVVGHADSTDGTQAFRYQNGTMQALGDLPGGFFGSQANAVSGDGTIVVGRSFGANGEEAFVWQSETGMRSLWEVLSEKEVDLSHWSRLISARAISSNGKHIAGFGLNVNGQVEAFLVQTPLEAIVIMHGCPAPFKVCHEVTSNNEDRFPVDRAPETPTPPSSIGLSVATSIAEEVDDIFEMHNINTSGVRVWNGIENPNPSHEELVEFLGAQPIRVYLVDFSPDAPQFRLQGKMIAPVGEHPVDRFNRRKSGEDQIVVFLNRRSPERVASTIAHEVGHAVGLYHLEPLPADDDGQQRFVMMPPNPIVRDRFSMIPRPTRHIDATHNPVYPHGKVRKLLHFQYGRIGVRYLGQRIVFDRQSSL